MLLCNTMWYVWCIWPLLCYKHAYYERWAIKIIFHAPCHRRGTDDDVRGWDDEWRIERDRLSVLCVNPSHPNIINDNRATHTNLCVHTHKHNSNITDKQRKGKKWDRKKLGWLTINMERGGERWPFFLSLCSRQPRWTDRKEQCRKDLTIYLYYIYWIGLMRVHLNLLCSVCEPSRARKYTNKHWNIWLKLHCLF